MIFCRVRPGNVPISERRTVGWVELARPNIVRGIAVLGLVKNSTQPTGAAPRELR